MGRILLLLVVRNFLKNKLLNGLNILGLSAGLTATGLILIYADHELSFDTFHFDPQNTYQLEAKTNSDYWFVNLGLENGRELLSGSHPEVKRVVQFTSTSRAFLSYSGQRFLESKIYRTNPGSEFFDLFNYDILEGPQDNLLAEPYALVLTQSMAKKYFGEKPALGEVIQYDTLNLKVTGIIEDVPSNSHLNFDFIYTHPVLSSDRHFHGATYIQLEASANPENIEHKLVTSEAEYDQFHRFTDAKLIPLPDVYFESQGVFGAAARGDRAQLGAFIIIGSLILLIAVANYVNLSFAIFSSKGLEIGMRKVLGESRSQVINAFICESFLIVILCLPIVVLSIQLLLPLFNELVGLELHNKFLSSPGYWMVGLASVVLIGLSSAAYPVTTLSGKSAGMLIKSKAGVDSSDGFELRNVLIFFQFLLLFTLGISAWFVYHQVEFIEKKDMGFETDHVIKIQNAWNIGSYENYQVFKTQLMSHPEIESVTHGPVMGDRLFPLTYQPQDSEVIYENLLSIGVGAEYFDLLDMEIVEGDFETALEAAESGQVISLVNQSFVKSLDWKDPIGKSLTLRPGTENELNRTVSAVFRDIHYFSLKEKIVPQIISLRKDPTGITLNILVKANQSKIKEALEIIEEEWYNLRPDEPMQYSLMSENIQKMYARDRQLRSMSLIFSIIAILLSALGLVGFMIYITGQKAKEIAIRKVLGASLLQIIKVLNRRLVTVIMIAALFGSTISYLLVRRWLNDYVYSIDINPVVFVAVTFLAYALVFAITAIQSIKTASVNPVLALKDE